MIRSQGRVHYTKPTCSIIIFLIVLVTNIPPNLYKSVRIKGRFCSICTLISSLVVYIRFTRILNQYMMRRTLKLALILVCLTAFLSQARCNDINELETFVQGMEDPYMTNYDLAFLLITHDYDAKPCDCYVLVNLNSGKYSLTPNGNFPGLANITKM